VTDIVSGLRVYRRPFQSESVQPDDFFPRQLIGSCNFIASVRHSTFDAKFDDEFMKERCCPLKARSAQSGDVQCTFGDVRFRSKADSGTDSHHVGYPSDSKHSRTAAQLLEFTSCGSRACSHVLDARPNAHWSYVATHTG
jgi:hypothetical protein